MLTLDGHTWITFDDSIVGPWVGRQVEFEWLPGKCSAIGRVVDGELVAGIVYENFNGANVMAHMAARGRWANRHFLWLIFDYPFHQLGASRMTVWVADSNKRSLRFVEKLGFERESLMMGAHPSGDIHAYRMFKDHCRWLRKQ